MSIADLFQKKAEKLTWLALPDTQIVNGAASEQIRIDEAYYVVRMKEMYVQNARKLWRKFYPMLHGFTMHAGEETHSVAGPGQLRELGEANLDRIVNLNHRLAGPTAVREDEVTLLVGLYSVPGDDTARALIDVVSTLAGMSGLSLGPAVPIVNAVKSGVENVLGLNETRLQIGIKNSFYPNDPLRSGYWVGINAPTGTYPADQLWVRDGRLLYGNDAFTARPFAGGDYMLLEIERREQLDSWPSLAGVQDMQERFSDILADPNRSVADKRAELGRLWPEFTELLRKLPQLTSPDRARIIRDVTADLQNRLNSIDSGNPFESRAFGEARSTAKDPRAFDFVDIGTYGPMPTGPDAQRLMATNPFGAGPLLDA